MTKAVFPRAGFIIGLIALAALLAGAVFSRVYDRYLTTSSPGLTRSGYVVATIDTTGLPTGSNSVSVSARTRSGGAVSASVAFSVVASSGGGGGSSGGVSCAAFGVGCVGGAPDGVCSSAESRNSCPQDCIRPHPPYPVCGDGYCTPYTENILICPADCNDCDGKCPAGPPPSTGSCNSPPETNLKCRWDCSGPAQGSGCGDYLCDVAGGEDKLNCPRDCAPYCSDTKENDRVSDYAIDINDSKCHLDGDPLNPASYRPRRDTETAVLTSNADSEDFYNKCANNRDDDGDGCIDGGDLDCRSLGGWEPTYEEDDPNSGCVTDNVEGWDVCYDGIDNDGDGKIDGADSGCHIDRDPNKWESYQDGCCVGLLGVPVEYGMRMTNECLSYVTDVGGRRMCVDRFLPCADSIDNDGDGYIDGGDGGCHVQSHRYEAGMVHPLSSRRTGAGECNAGGRCYGRIIPEGIAGSWIVGSFIGYSHMRLTTDEEGRRLQN